MSDAKFNLSAAPGVTGYIGIKFYEASAPTVEVASQQIAGPHTAEVQVIQTGLNPVSHIIKIYDTPGFPTLGTLLHEFWFDVRSNTVTNERRFYTVGGAGATDPAAGGTTITDSYLNGKTITGAFKAGYGIMQPTTDYTINPSGGIILVSPNILSAGEVYCIEVSYAVSAPPAVAGAAIWTDLVAHTANFTLATTDMSKIHSFESTTNKITGTLPALSGVADKSVLKFISYTGLQNNATIQASGSDTILYGNNTTQKLYLGINETITLMKKGSVWYVIDEKSDANEVGRVLFADKILPNTVEAKGQLLNRLDYPRLWAYANSLGALLITDATWTGNANRSGFFSSGDGSTTFRVPDLRGVFLRGLDGTRAFDPDRVTAGQQATPGYYQGDAAGPHVHKDPQAGNGSHSTGSTASSGVQRVLTGNGTPVSEFTFNQFDSGTVQADYGTTTPAATETRGKNVAKYALIKF